MVGFFQNDRFVVINCSLFKNVEMLCEYAHSSTNRMLEKMIPILEHFSQKEICLTSYEERKMAQSHFTSTIPEGFENVTFIIDATPLPIQHQRSDASSRENGVWDGAHKMWGTYPLRARNHKCASPHFLQKFTTSPQQTSSK
jgi:hypothetical protein